MKFSNCRIPILIFLLSISANELFCQNQLWIRDLTNDKEFLLPKRNYNTYFRVNKSYWYNPHDTLLSRFYNPQFSLDSSFIGNPFEFVSASDDSITLELDYYWKQGITFPTSTPPTYDSTGTIQVQTLYLTPYTRRIALDDISEIYVQRTYHKFSDDVWVYGGFFGALSVILSPFFYFTDNKEVGIGLFSLGAAGITASVISYKFHIGYDEFKKPHFEFFWDQ